MPPRTSPSTHRTPARILALFFVASVTAAAVSAAGAGRQRPTLEDVTRNLDEACRVPGAPRCAGGTGERAMPTYAAQKAELEGAARLAQAGDATNAKETVARVLGRAREIDRRGGRFAHLVAARLTRRALDLVKAHDRVFDDAFVVHALEAAPSTTGEAALDEDTVEVERRVLDRVASSPRITRALVGFVVPFDLRALEARRRVMRARIAEGDAPGCQKAASTSSPLFDGPGPGSEGLACASGVEMSRTVRAAAAAKASARARLQAGSPR
jgi:hypothetical protein